VLPFPVGVIVPSCVSSGLAKVCMKPCRRFLEKLKVCFFRVVGVAGGDDGPAGGAKLKFGVVGLIMAASIEVRIRLLCYIEQGHGVNARGRCLLQVGEGRG